ncbi:hypothetical protein [Zhongshania sp.]|uniref:hypothetical protein n=1 Tax=Zhongshania sp. TaxID=1971902 RepID=UPI003565224C
MIHKSEITQRDPLRAQIEAQVAEYLEKGGEVKTVPAECRQDDNARVKSFLYRYEEGGE